jgi:hypothetical protein
MWKYSSPEDRPAMLAKACADNHVALVSKILLDKDVHLGRPVDDNMETKAEDQGEKVSDNNNNSNNNNNSAINAERPPPPPLPATTPPPSRPSHDHQRDEQSEFWFRVQFPSAHGSPTAPNTTASDTISASAPASASASASVTAGERAVGDTLVSDACAAGNVDVLRLLINSGRSDIKRATQADYNLAESRGYTEVMELLIAKRP